jgi:cation diffusion facilitator CzcD-associated flavoprotein CzcO
MSACRCCGELRGQSSALTEEAAVDRVSAASLGRGDPLDRYKEERDKRLRAGRRGMPDLEGELAKYLDDPYTKASPRVPVNDSVDVLIVGAGFGGLMIAASLRDVGVTRIRLVDTAGDVGGVWYWNRYPGVACDVEAAIYLPLLEKVGELPRAKYASGPVIFAHAQAIARHYSLYADALLQTTVTEMAWVEDKFHWLVTTDRGDQVRAQFVILANGPLQRLKLPEIDGIETFTGAAFHTSRWDFDYTGGSATTDPTKLADKVVCVIGTGATAVQCVPPLGRAAKELYVFQRTPPTVAPRDNMPIDDESFKDLEEGWQARRRRNFTIVTTTGLADEDLVHDGWTEVFRVLIGDPMYKLMTPEEAQQARASADLTVMEKIRARIDSIVDDPQTAEALKPYYSYLCKRPTFHDEYLQTFNLPNVHLIDTDGQGVESVYSHGVIANGRKYPFDCIVFATGFEVGTAFTRRIGFDVVGRNGARLSEHWSDGLRTLHGIATSQFPNMFVQPAPDNQNVPSINFIDKMQENAEQMAYILSEVRRRGHRAFVVTESAESAWVDTIIMKSPDDARFLRECTPGRWNNEGRPDERPLGNRDYGGGPVEFFKLLEDWRETGSLPGLQLEG